MTITHEISKIAEIPLEVYCGFNVDETGTVYGKRGRPLIHSYMYRGYRVVTLTASKMSPKCVRIDRLMGLAFHGIELDDKGYEVLYRDSDFNNVNLSNLLFIKRKE